jgi:hypothetical protein
MLSNVVDKHRRPDTTERRRIAEVGALQVVDIHRIHGDIS